MRTSLRAAIAALSATVLLPAGAIALNQTATAQAHTPRAAQSQAQTAQSAADRRITAATVVPRTARARVLASHRALNDYRAKDRAARTARAKAKAAPHDRRLRRDAAAKTLAARTAKLGYNKLAAASAADTARPARASRSARTAPAPTVYGIWDSLAQCEAGGNWSINTGNGYYGGLQFSAGSWRAVGGTGLPHQHSRSEQIRRGELLQDRQGWGAWPSCSRKLGLR